MSDAQKALVSPLTEELLPDVVRIHREGLGYTVNSRLGSAHLAFLYQKMASDPSSYVGVAIRECRPAGIISGTLNEDRLKSNLLNSMSARQLAGLVARVLVQPWLMLPWLQSLIVARPIYQDGNEIMAVLTALAVDPAYRGQGVGRQLVTALEVFFGDNKIEKYRLDTLATNDRALRFYKDLGFTEAGRRAGSVILVRQVGR